jgi:hypothetical protein
MRVEITDQYRRTEVLKLWLELPEAERNGETAILNFYHWLEKNRPELLERGHGDPYQHLRVDLTGQAN